MRAGQWVVVLGLSCASQQRLPPGNELEVAEAASASERSTVHESKMPGQSNELARAFEPPAPVTAPPRQEAVTSAPAVVDPSAEERAHFLARLDEARRAVARADFEVATPLLEQLEQEVARLSPVEAATVAELQFRGASTQKEWRSSRKAAERWLESCGPERVELCRAKALGALGRVAAQKSPEAAAARARMTQTKTADRCLADAERAARARGSLPGCLESANAHFRHHGDALMVARVALAKAQAASGDPAKKEQLPGLLEHAARVCSEPRCAAVRRRALKQAGWLELQEGNPEQAARLMIEDMGVAAEGFPPDKRRYARTTEVDKVCAALDARDGAGSCRKLEKQVLGDYFFTDFSTRKAGAGLAADTVRTVNEHYNVSLQECLAAEAARLTPPAYETYQVRWMVGNDGRVDQVHMSRKDQDETELALCLRRVFVVWRYPRYEGEAQHIEQSFTVSAHTRGRH